MEVFHMRCLRRILDIMWSDVVDNKISNKNVRTSFNNIRKVKSLIAIRRLLFVGKVIRIPCKKIPARHLSAFHYKNDLKGFTTVRHSILDDIRKIIPTVDKYGSFKTWAHIANNELLCLMLVNNLGKYDLRPCNFSLEWDGEIL